MKSTPFTSKQIALGAKMHEFAGYNMPTEFAGIMEEHMTVLLGVGVFDVSHMGEIWVRGAKALSFLQRVTSNDVSVLYPGKAQYSCLPNNEGGVIDDILVYCFAPDCYLLVVNASNIEKDFTWLKAQNIEHVELENRSEQTAQLAIQGPLAKDLLQTLTSTNLDAMPYYTFQIGSVAGVDEVIISNTGYTGAGGFEIYFPNEAGDQIWDALFKKGEDFGLKPIGLGARDTLRLEMGYCLYGNDINDVTTPIEAGLGWITKFVPEKPFIGREILEKQKRDGVSQKLVAFQLTEKGIPRKGYPLLDEQGNQIGEVTSGTISPTLKAGIGMGYVSSEFAALGGRIFIGIRNRPIAAEIVKTPFRK